MHPYAGGLLPHIQFRPLSVLILNTTNGPINEDDMMISVSPHHCNADHVSQMLDGGHVCRCSLVSLMDAFPCVHVKKYKPSAFQESKAFKNVECHKSPNCVQYRHSSLVPREWSGHRKVYWNVRVSKIVVLLMMEKVCPVVSIGVDLTVFFVANEF